VLHSIKLDDVLHGDELHSDELHTDSNKLVLTSVSLSWPAQSLTQAQAGAKVQAEAQVPQVAQAHNVLHGVKISCHLTPR